jgi:hypothetical protein
MECTVLRDRVHCSGGMHGVVTEFIVEMECTVTTVRQGGAPEKHAFGSHIHDGLEVSNIHEFCHYTDDVTRMLSFNTSSNMHES